ncbi:hypothetical protein [Plantactinospora sp. WMMB782]|uniref:hypothetical protein n=1 Tax=Plantactinospora sp. WMMB782 TaxID=3404121 RepID=UPI003B9351FC
MKVPRQGESSKENVRQQRRNVGKLIESIRGLLLALAALLAAAATLVGELLSGH